MRTVLMGQRPFYAPETDDGGDYDDADADDLETPDAPAEDDEPDEDADAEPDDADEPEELDDEPVAPQQTRGERRFQELSRRTQEAERRAEEAERRIAEAERNRNSEAAAAAERERLAMMTPEEQVEYRVNQRLARIEFSTWDTNDRVQFEGMASGNPAVSAIKDEVEATFQAQVRAGRPTDRATIAAFLIGQKALAKAPAAARKAKKAADAGRARNTARPTSGRGDVAPSRGGRLSEHQARAKRLENIEL